MTKQSTQLSYVINKYELYLNKNSNNLIINQQHNYKVIVLVLV